MMASDAKRFQAAVASGASFETPEGYSNWESNVFNRCIHYEESVPLPSVREGNQRTREWVIDMHLLAWELEAVPLPPRGDLRMVVYCRKCGGCHFTKDCGNPERFIAPRALWSGRSSV